MNNVNSNRLQYKICNFEIPKQNIQLGGYHFERVPDYGERIDRLYKSAIVKKLPIKKIRIPEKEGSHQITVIATPLGKEENSKLLMAPAPRINDVLLLYNFFKRRNSCIFEDKYKTDHRFDEAGIQFDNYEIFKLIKVAFQTIHEPNWLDKNQESIFPFHWLMESRVPKVFEISYVSRWVAFEILWKSKILKEEFKNILNDYIKKINKNFEIEFYERFLANIRHCIVHQGTCNFKNFLNQFNDPRSRFKPPHKKFFNQHINKNNFSEFKYSSRYVLDSLLTIFFAKIFGIENVNNRVIGNEIEWIKSYLQSLNIPDLVC